MTTLQHQGLQINKKIITIVITRVQHHRLANHSDIFSSLVSVSLFAFYYFLSPLSELLVLAYLPDHSEIAFCLSIRLYSAFVILPKSIFFLSGEGKSCSLNEWYITARVPLYLSLFLSLLFCLCVFICHSTNIGVAVR